MLPGSSVTRTVPPGPKAMPSGPTPNGCGNPDAKVDRLNPWAIPADVITMPASDRSHKPNSSTPANKKKVATLTMVYLSNDDRDLSRRKPVRALVVIGEDGRMETTNRLAVNEGILRLQLDADVGSKRQALSHDIASSLAFL